MHYLSNPNAIRAAYPRVQTVEPSSALFSHADLGIFVGAV